MALCSVVPLFDTGSVAISEVGAERPLLRGHPQPGLMGSLAPVTYFGTSHSAACFGALRGPKLMVHCPDSFVLCCVDSCFRFFLRLVAVVAPVIIANRLPFRDRVLR